MPDTPGMVITRNAELKIQRVDKRPNPAFVPSGCALIAIGSEKDQLA